MSAPLPFRSSRSGQTSPARGPAHGAARAPGPLAEEIEHSLAHDPFALSGYSRDRRLADIIQRFERGEADEALGMLADLLEEEPGWVEGHAIMAQLLSQTGSATAFDAFLAGSIHAAGDDMAVATTCLRLLSEAGRHEQVDILLPLLRTRAGDHLFFTLMEAVTASELDDADRANRLFACAAAQGGLLSLPHVRHLIRTGDATQAATLAQAYVEQHPAHQGAWGLLGTAWRLTGDSRHDWLCSQSGLVATVDLDISAVEIEGLTKCLRRLHVARFHPFDQSLRGGTQTPGRLFLRDEPDLQSICGKFHQAMRTHLDGLPPVDRRHPLLGADRSRFRFTDSWSVRLVDGGFHVSHFHPQGTLSSAFYVTYPQDPRQSGYAGWLTIGEPPECLRTGLPPLRMIEPKVGRLALFPSFMWHGTRPFPKGERMTIAFDTVLGH